MNWHPDRGVRVKRHSLEYEVPRDRQLDSLEIERPGEITVVTDTVFAVRCSQCGEEFREPTESASTSAFTKHEESLPNHRKTSEYKMPGWFRAILQSRQADIAKLQYDHEGHDY